MRTGVAAPRIESAPRAPRRRDQRVHTPLPQWAIWSEVAIRVGWAATAAVIWAAMTRRGHDGGLWALIGLVLGPFAVPAAITSARRAARRPPIVVADGAPWDAGRGPAVLVVVDPDDPGSGPAQAAAADAAGGPIELVVVVGRDTLDRSAREGTLRRARAAPGCGRGPHGGADTSPGDPRGPPRGRRRPALPAARHHHGRRRADAGRCARVRRAMSLP